MVNHEREKAKVKRLLNLQEKAMRTHDATALEAATEGLRGYLRRNPSNPAPAPEPAPEPVEPPTTEGAAWAALDAQAEAYQLADPEARARAIAEANGNIEQTMEAWKAEPPS